MWGCCCHGYHKVERVDDVIRRIAVRLWCAVHSDLCEVQQPLPIGQHTRPIKLHLQVASVTQWLPADVHLWEKVTGHAIVLNHYKHVGSEMNLEGEEQQTADILCLLCGRFTDHMTTEGGGAWWTDSVRIKPANRVKGQCLSSCCDI